MAQKTSLRPNNGTDGKATKLSRLPKNVRVQKRPILRPSIPSPYAGATQQKVIYVSAKTPFISAVKRVRKLLSEIDKRYTGKIVLVEGSGTDKQKLKRLGTQVNPSLGKEPEEVVLKATNKAIQNVLGLALYFQGQEDCKVRLRTSSVGVVDDIVESANAPDDGRPDNDNPVKENDEVPESRIRKMSVVEVAITLK